jgi:catechol 2,3-dioxygenase-like lactoylglutathione lyase family enzyme
MPMSLRFEIFVADLDATVEFYRNALAFSLVRDERSADLPYVGMERDDVRGPSTRTSRTGRGA